MKYQNKVGEVDPPKVARLMCPFCAKTVQAILDSLSIKPSEM
jgi:hypothetical protein